MLARSFLTIMITSALVSCGGDSNGDTESLTLALNGEDTIEVEAGSRYEELGAVATDGDGNKVNVTTTGTVDTSELGSFTVTYTALDATGEEYTVTRTVKVVDTTAPEIEIRGGTAVTLLVNSAMVDPLVVATDSYEGVISCVKEGSVDTSTPGVYSVTYTSVDSSGNQTKKTVTYTVKVPDVTPPVITVAGDNPLDIEFGSVFSDPGATATDNEDASVTVTSTGNVDMSALGTYTITYTATDSSGNTSSATRAVEVVDTTPPVITMAGANPLIFEFGAPFYDPSANPIDAVDGPVSMTRTHNVDTSVLGTYTINYSATDSSGNATSITRTVEVVDTTPPVVSLLGDGSVELLAGEVFTDAGATANDTVDGDLSASISLSGSVDTNTPGSYTLTYSVADASGNTGTATRNIDVLPSAQLTILTKDYFTGTPVTFASVDVMSVEGGNSVTRSGMTDATDGSLDIIVNAAAERIVVYADAPDYGEYSKTVVADNQNVTVLLQPSNDRRVINAFEDYNINISGYNIVSVPADSLVDAAGNPPSGTLDAELTVIDSGLYPDLMPGNYETVDPATGEVEQIESYGAISMSFMDADRNVYNLAAGQTATVRIPLASNVSEPPTTIPLYYFDEATGYWVEDGVGTYVDDGTNQYYQGTVTHFTTWNADYLYQSITINGCVVDLSGTPIADAEVFTQGQDYNGRAWAVTDEQGNFSVNARPESNVLLSVSTRGGLSRTSEILTDTEDITQSTCITVEPSAAMVTLTWGEDPYDLDTQFFGPSIEDQSTYFLMCYIHKDVQVDTSHIWLDVDDTDSYGPEITTISSFPFPGRYTYAVYRYYGENDVTIAQSPARVELEFDNQHYVFSPPSGTATDCWSVFDFVVADNGDVMIEENAQWQDEDYCYARGYVVEDPTEQYIDEQYSEVSVDTATRFAPMISTMALREPKPISYQSLLKTLVESKYYAK